MVVRLTYIKFLAGTTEEVKKIYNEEIVPAAKMQKGNVSIRMIESVDNSNEFISISEWASKEDAELYESSGLYKNLVAKLLDFTASAPVLKTYLSEDALIAH